MWTSSDSKYSLMIVLSVAVCYCTTYRGQFVFDDTEALVNNPDVQGNNQLRNVFSNDFWGIPMKNNASHKSYRPLTILVFRSVNQLLRSLNSFKKIEPQNPSSVASPAVYRLINLVCYSFVCVYLMWIFRLILVATKNCPKSKQNSDLNEKSFLAALLFAVHPIHTEVVCSIVGLADLLSAVVYLFVLHLYLTWFCINKKESVLLSLIIVVISGVSMLFKEQGLTALGLCFAIELIFHPPNFKRLKIDASVLRLILLIFGASLLLIFRLFVMGFSAPQFHDVDNPASFEENFFIRVLNFNYIYSLNFWLLIQPLWLCFDWSMGCLPLIRSCADTRIYSIILLWICFLLIFIKSFSSQNTKFRRRLQLSLALIIIPFVPSSNIFFRVGFVIAERSLFLSSIGYVLLLLNGWILLKEYFPQVKIIKTSLIFLCFINAAKTFQRHLDWIEETQLFESALSVCPLNAKVHYNIAKVASSRGDKQKTVDAYRKAIDLNPNYDHAMNNLANILKDDGLFEEAKELLLRAVVIRPTFAAAWMNLGIVQVAMKQYDEAESSYAKALQHRKNYPDCHYNLGNLYVIQKRHEEAFEQWKRSVILKPKLLQAWNNMIVLYDNLGKLEEAKALALEAFKHHPNEGSLFFNFANVLGKLNKFEEAEIYFKKAINLMRNNSAVYANFGVLYHRWKRYDLAKTYYQEALRLNPRLNTTLQNLNSLQKFL